MRTVFLDIDGVLRSNYKGNNQNTFDRACVNALNQICEGYEENVQFVLLSGWQEKFTRAEIEKLFQEAGFKGKLHEDSITVEKNETSNNLVLEWLIKHKVKRQYVCLTSRLDIFNINRSVYINSYLGITIYETILTRFLLGFIDQKQAIVAELYYTNYKSHPNSIYFVNEYIDFKPFSLKYDYEKEFYEHELVKRFHTYRQIYSISHEEFASMAKIDVITVQNFEDASFDNVSLEEFCKIMKALGCKSLIREFIPYDLVDSKKVQFSELLRLGKKEEAHTLLVSPSLNYEIERKQRSNFSQVSQKTAYESCWLYDTQKHFAIMMSIAILRCGYLPDVIMQMFIDSGIAWQLESGSPRHYGLYGMDILRDVIFRTEHKHIDDKDLYFYSQDTKEFWAAWTLAFYQWFSCQTFEEINSYLPFSKIIQLYDEYSEKTNLEFIAFAEKERKNKRIVNREIK